jgi:hypothetical protein
MTYNIDPDYIDVAERLKLFYAAYPDGRLQTDRPWVEIVGDSVFVCCIAHAYRTADDISPSTGVAWEPVPGPTPFTKDSELMNAQTSAWGRAIVAAGIPSKKIATAQDVQARQGAPAAEGDGRTAAQNRNLWRIVSDLEKSGAPPPDGSENWKEYSRNWIRKEFGKESSKDLTVAEAGKLIDHLDPPF